MHRLPPWCGADFVGSSPTIYIVPVRSVCSRHTVTSHTLAAYEPSTDRATRRKSWALARGARHGPSPCDPLRHGVKGRILEFWRGPGPGFPSPCPASSVVPYSSVFAALLALGLLVVTVWGSTLKSCLMGSSVRCAVKWKFMEDREAWLLCFLQAGCQTFLRYPQGSCCILSRVSRWYCLRLRLSAQQVGTQRPIARAACCCRDVRQRAGVQLDIMWD